MTWVGYGAATLAVAAFSGAVVTGVIGEGFPQGADRASAMQDLARRENYATAANWLWTTGAVLTGVDEPEATRIAERLRAAVAAQAFDVRGRGHRITVSIGVAAFRDGDLQASLRSADEALYRAKANGRNQVVNGVSARPGSSSVQEGQALKAGGRSDGAPGLRPHDRVRYYAAFIVDPDGNRIEAVTFPAE